MYSFVLDLTVFLIFAIFIFLGIKNGIVKSAMSFFGTLIAFLFSIYSAGEISDFIYVRFLKESIKARIDLAVSKGESLESIFSLFPGFIINSLKFYGITMEKINHIIRIF